MNFLEAHKIVQSFSGGPELALLVGMSGTGEALTLYLKAAFAELGRTLRVRFLPFGTLQQSIRFAERSGEEELFILFPWDLIPALDWRSGFVEVDQDEAQLRMEASQLLAAAQKRAKAIVYVDAPFPASQLDQSENSALRHGLLALALEHGATVVDGEHFSLGNYLGSGNPFQSRSLGVLARHVATRCVEPTQSCKVLITDLDHTLWHGVIGDDGVEGIAYAPEGKGYRHFVYQTFLRRLQRSGVLLAAVSKNDPAVAQVPFQDGAMTLKSDDFVAILASWQPKSAQLSLLAEQLNLGLDSFVFVDDNSVEIAEVNAALPAVRTRLFPSAEADLPAFFDNLVGLFHRDRVTSEDRERTALYRRRLSTLPPREGSGADLTGFLRELQMQLMIEERTAGDRSRALQLINKTNQFNLNGVRLSDEELDAAIADGARLFTASLSDRGGDHGQITAALIRPDGTLSSWVMSCRVFQRRVEFAFLGALAQRGIHIRRFDYRATEKNAPTRNCLRELVTEAPVDGLVDVETTLLTGRADDALTLFAVLQS